MLRTNLKLPNTFTLLFTGAKCKAPCHYLMELCMVFKERKVLFKCECRYIYVVGIKIMKCIIYAHIFIQTPMNVDEHTKLYECLQMYKCILTSIKSYVSMSLIPDT